MAKIGALQIDSIKLAAGTLNSFYHNTSVNTTPVSITVPSASNNPTLLFGRCFANNAFIVRTRGGEVLGTAEGVPPYGSCCFICFDPEPINGDTYTLTGMLYGSTNEIGAIVRLK